MSSLQFVNSSAENAKKATALTINITAAKGLQDIMKTNLGPKGTMKMLVGGAGDIKITKDGNVLLHEMQIQHPTATMIARTATAQDDILGDGTTSTVLLTGEILKQCEKYLTAKLHPSVLVDGIEMAMEETLKFLDTFKISKETVDHELLVSVARTSLRTKLREEVADLLANIVVDAVNIIKKPDQPIDLHMVEIMHMEHKMDTETRLINGLVLDHGTRHPNMKKHMEDVFILTANVSLEYEKSEVNSGFFYSNAEERKKLVEAERRVVDKKVQAIIDLKNAVCGDSDKGFIVINQQGIDPISLDLLAANGIMALRRAKRRNMERLTLACGGIAINSVEDLSPEVLGHADKVYEHVLGEDKFTFVEGVSNPLSCTILIKGPNKHTIAQIKDAIRDGLRAVKNTIEEKAVVPGAGAFELACHKHLNEFEKQVHGKTKLGVRAFSEALLVIPRTLAENSGFDAMDTILKLEDELDSGVVVGLDIYTGEAIDVEAASIFDNYRVKRQSISASTYTASQLLYVDEIMRAGKQMRKMEQ